MNYLQYYPYRCCKWRRHPVVPFSLAVVRMVAVVATTKRVGLLIMAYYLMKRWNTDHQWFKDTRIKRQGLTLSGGDPMHPRNVEALLPFVQRVKKECPDKDIWVWTGYKLDELDDINVKCCLILTCLLMGNLYKNRLTQAWFGAVQPIKWFIVLRFNRIRLSYSAKPFL